MPYIKKAQKYKLAIEPPSTTGELNYLFTRLMIQYTQRFGIKYNTFNDVIGAIESAKIEYYRRVVAPYEKQKIIENGDVYPDSLVKENVTGITPLPDK